MYIWISKREATMRRTIRIHTYMYVYQPQPGWYICMYTYIYMYVCIPISTWLRMYVLHLRVKAFTCTAIYWGGRPGGIAIRKLFLVVRHGVMHPVVTPRVSWMPFKIKKSTFAGLAACARTGIFLSRIYKVVTSVWNITLYTGTKFKSWSRRGYKVVTICMYACMYNIYVYMYV